MIFTHFGLLRSPYCKMSYLLTLKYVLKFDNLHMTQCAKIIVRFMANVGNVFMKRLQSFFFTFFFVLMFFFLNFYLNVYYINEYYKPTHPAENKNIFHIFVESTIFNKKHFLFQ